MHLSSNTLFHFTKIDSLIGILKSKEFWPIYNLEKFTSEYYDNHEYAIPMVCFCDLKLSLTTYHQRQYGASVIGLKKQWGIAQKLNPITYLFKDSAITSSIEDLTQLLMMLTDNESPEMLPLEIKKDQIESNRIKYIIHKSLITIHAFKKQYQSDLAIEVPDQFISYYDEREWRYIPEMMPKDLKDYENIKASGHYHQLAIDKEVFHNSVSKAKYQEYVNEKYALKFNEDEVDIVIVDSDEEKLKIQNELKSIYGSLFLNNKVKTYSEIKTDQF